MLTFAYYLLKVMLCTAIFFVYYWLALRNKKFHLYNRFYLLASVALSWIIPLIKIDFWNEDTQQQQVIKLLTVVANANRYVEEASLKSQFHWSWNDAAIISFVLISAIFFVSLVITIIRIMLLISRNEVKKWNEVFFVFSNAKGTPFSFFKHIFWNQKIDLDTSEGQHILKHELVHVRERHTADKVFMNLSQIVGWYNPVLWLLTKELNMIHEFIADEKAIKDGDVTGFAAMLLKTAYPQHSFTLANSFFYSPVKRRFLMLTSSKKTSFTYLRRVAILPLLMFTCVLFAFGMKKGKIMLHNSRFVNNDTVTSGHNISNSEGDEKVNGEDFQDTTKKKKPDNKSKSDAAALSNIPRVDSGKDAIRKELIVLDGKYTTWKELDKVDPSQIKQTTALKDAEATNKYGEKGKNGVVEITTKQSSESQTSGEDSSNIYKYDKIFTKVENPAYYPTGMAAFADYINSNMQYPKEAIQNKIEGAVLIQFIVNDEGKLTNFEKLSDKGYGLEEEAIRLIKNSGRWKPAIQNGRNVVYRVKQEIVFKHGKEFYTSEKEGPAQYPGGLEEWRKYLERNLNLNVLAKHKAPKGKYPVVVSFTVNKDGDISNVATETKTGYGTEDEAIRTISKAPEWVPAKKDGVFVDSQVKQTITFTVTEKGWAYDEINSITTGDVKTTYVSN